ncbi:hypothetical protein KIN20_019091 [Parelaphostrongylus tenuis]|uniref:Uncharacterized protein n=1 Tax=Parelaphostrongylus tenuis TaxID=148309 RepID=A0AAD5QS26_PARTN|nr:hypothetical protein KIN20_019091 [Parelaphostrongylus tenuis]
MDEARVPNHVDAKLRNGMLMYSTKCRCNVSDHKYHHGDWSRMMWQSVVDRAIRMPWSIQITFLRGNGDCRWKLKMNYTLS